MTCDEAGTTYNSGITIDDLDVYSLLQLFEYLSPNDKLTAEKVCTKWKWIAQQSWKSTRKIVLVKKDLTINNCTKDVTNGSDILKIIKRCKNYVRILELYTYYPDSNHLAEQIINVCKNLQSVVLCGVSKTVVFNLAKKNRDLREFYLRDVSQSVDDILSKLFRRNQKLTSVDLLSVNTKTYGTYVQQLPIANLQSFSSVLSNMSHENIMWIANEAKNLSKLTFEEYRIDEKCIKLISKMNSLRCLKVGVYLPFVKNFQQLLSLKNLQKIDVSSCPLVTDEFLHNLSEFCLNISDVNIAGCSVTNTGVIKVATLPRLERLNLNLLPITEQAFVPMPNLRELECGLCKNLSNRYFINVVKYCENLELLNVSYCSKVNNSLINSAVVDTRNRTNGVVLTIFVGHSRVRHSKLKESSPRLHVIFNVRFV